MAALQARAARKAKLEERLALEAENKRKAVEQEAARPAKRQATENGGDGVQGVEVEASNGAAEGAEPMGHPAPQGVPGRSPGPIPEGEGLETFWCFTNLARMDGMF